MNYHVSIVLCSHNRATHLENTLQSLGHVSVPEDWNVELILVDNASTDATLDVMRAFTHPEIDVRVVREGKKGVSNARNRGVNEAEGSVLLFTDDDLRFPQRWIERMCTPILHGEADAVAGGVELAENLQADWMTPRHRALLASTETLDPDQPERLVGANMAIAKRIFDTIPCFDPELGAGQLGSGEETLFSWQMRKAGFQIETAFDTAVEHHPDPLRLSRGAWEDMAKKGGWSDAYCSYHWGHRRYSRLALYAGWVYYCCRLWWKRVGRGTGERAIAGMPMWEIHLQRRIYRIRGHLHQQGQQFKYAQRGFAKYSTD